MLVQQIVGQWETMVTGEGHHGSVPFYELWYGLGTGVEVAETGTEQWRLHTRCPCNTCIHCD